MFWKNSSRLKKKTYVFRVTFGDGVKYIPNTLKVSGFERIDRGGCIGKRFSHVIAHFRNRETAYIHVYIYIYIDIGHVGYIVLQKYLFVVLCPHFGSNFLFLSKFAPLG